MRYASAKRRVQGNPLRMTIVPRTKTSSVILKILKILIQKKVTAGEYYIETCRGEDASIANPRIREIPIFLKILIQNQVKAGEYYIETCRGEDASIANPRIREIPIFLKILIQKKVTACEYYIETCRGEDASIASLQDIQ
jgi:hypothetical protein